MRLLGLDLKHEWTFTIKNPLFVLRRRWQFKRAIAKWNRDRVANSEKAKRHVINADDEQRYGNGFFKWNEIIWQEILMYIRIGHPVHKSDIVRLCRRCRLDADMGAYIIEMLRYTWLYDDAELLPPESKRDKRDCSTVSAIEVPRESEVERAPTAGISP